MADVKDEILTAYLYAAAEPNDIQKARFVKFITKKYDKKAELKWVPDDMMGSGFKLVVGEDVFNWTNEGRLSQLKDMLDNLNAGKAATGGELISLIKSSVKDWSAEAISEEEGYVKTVGDGIVVADGLSSVVYGEIVVFESGEKGMVQDLRSDEIGIILFGDDQEIRQGSRVRRTKKTAGIPVGEDFLGRVVNPLGEPIDGLGPIKSDGYRAVESPAPGIIERQSVDTPMNTGILSIDSMFPIGKGQRELIIGDRQTGKTAIAVDTILNQKDNDVICIYVAIGQKASSVVALASELLRAGALSYTIIVSATAAESAPIQYIAPYSGCAMAEYFREQGKDVLIIYDDLSKHAVAYRALSLLIRRPPGREAYPGDVFYLHSRLLERAACVAPEFGGGSITALPIVETQAGDVSAYIPTNVISITDGQIFLESELFHSGIIPAINPGISVSRVGGSAQVKAMKKVAGELKLLYSQYRELQEFSQFGSDLDSDTKARLHLGERIVKVLGQDRNSPVEVGCQVAIIYAVIKGYLNGIAIDKVVDFENKLYETINLDHKDWLVRIRTGSWEKEDEAELKDLLEKMTKDSKSE